MEYAISLKNKRPASPMLYGLFFEDINHSLDGGLNANLLQNGNFEFSYFNYNSLQVQRNFDHFRFWSIEPQKLASVTDEKPIHANNPHSLKIYMGQDDGDVVLRNFGYELKDNANHIFLPDGAFECSFFYCADNCFEVECFFEYAGGSVSKSVILQLEKSDTYRQVKFALKGKKGSYATLVFKVKGALQGYFTNFRLIPNNYFRSKKNGYKYGKLNAALVKSLDIGAKFLRFPGGCLVEGDVSTDFLYEWEKTIGPLETRCSKPSVWNYLQSNEIGFFEYFCLCEDLGLSPVPVHHVGLACQIRSQVFRHSGYIALHPSSNEFKQKVVSSVAHLLYFAKGDPASKDKEESLWAQKRVESGHPKPFKLQFVALGNENWDTTYFRNFNAAVNALKKYNYAGKPTDILQQFGITIITSAGVDINPQDTNPSWQYIVQNYKDYIVDEHVYNTPEWFVDNFYRYDHYDKTQCKVFSGEYGCHTDADGKGLLGGKNNFTSALCEAVYLCGLENNPDVVHMSCYAPLFVKKYHSNWYPDLIEFDADKITYTPNYHLQSLFMQNYGKYSIRPQFEKTGKIKGSFVVKKQENVIQKTTFFDAEGKIIDVKLDDECESEKELDCYSAQIDFAGVPTSFTVGLAVNKHQDFGFYLHYTADQHLFIEKIVAGKRMTFEHLYAGSLTQSVKFSIDGKQIKVFAVCGNRQKQIASKVVWKTQEKTFSSLTFDKNKIYIKVVNISAKPEEVEYKLDPALVAQNIEGRLVCLQEGEEANKVVKSTKTIKASANNLRLQLAPKSINVVTIDR